MKIALYILLPVLLAITSIGLVYKGVDNVSRTVKESGDGMCMDMALKLVPSNSATKKMNDSDYIAIREVLYGLAKAKKLDVMVSQTGNKGSFKISSNAKTEDETKAFLANYEGVQSYLTTLQSLPYSMEFESFCLGKGCQGGFVTAIKVKE